MIGSKSIEVNWKNWVQGMTTSNVTEDGGFSIGNGGSSVSTSVVNPIYSPGLLYFPSDSTDKSTGLTGQVIASCEDISNGAYGKLIVSADADQDGRYYTMASDGTLTARGAEDTTNNFIQGKTDIIGFDGEAYVTTDKTIERWQLPATFNDGATFPFSFSDTSAPHPALVYENNAYFGDGNELLRMTAAGGTPTVILTLPTNQVIVTLGIDPGSGLMLISIINELNISGTLAVNPRVGYYDGFSNKLRKVVLVDDMITSFSNVGGTVFVGYGQNFGYWTGTGIQFLRKLNIGFDNAELIYKHKVTNIGQIVYIAEKSRILAFGEVMQGQGRSWWYAYQNAPSGVLTSLTFITDIGQNRLAFSYATSQFFTFDTRSVASNSNSGLVYTKKFDFPRAVTFNAVIIEYSAAVAANTNIGLLTVDYDNGLSETLPTVRTAETGKYIFEVTYPTIKTRSFQVRYVAYTNTGIERMTVFYNDKE